MATPHVAGAAALLLATNPGLTPQQVRDALVTAAKPNVVTDPGAGSPNKLLQSTSLPAPSGYAVTGIDVSSHDHAVTGIDWAAQAADGLSFAYVKATEGTSYVNPYFSADYQAAKNAGLYVGAYAFGRPDLGNPVGQADYLVNHALWAADDRTLVPFLDLEWPYSGLGLPACWGLSTAQMSAWIHGFVGEVEKRIGRQPMIYTNANWWNPCTGNDASFGAYPLDIAGYSSTPPTLPAGWSSFAIWQYAAGTSGVAGSYDRDVAKADLATLTGSATPPTTVSLVAGANGRFVTAESAGTAPLIANRTGVGQWEQFDQVDAGGGYVALRSHANGLYVTAENGGAAPLVANRTAIGAWEKFQVVANADGTVSLKANANGRYVTAENGGSAALIANRDAIGAWEKFTSAAPPTVVSLRATANGSYVTAENGGSAPLIANRGAVGLWEQFDRFDVGGGYIALRSHANGNYVTAENAGSAPLIANRTAIGAWEKFQVVSNADGTISLKANANGQFVSAANGGAAALIANRTTVGASEKFTQI
jgi:GH25 family lysozyme M1 (1,4-beta-N-acetylmuramidase)